MTENAGHETNGRSKSQGIKLQNVKQTDEIAGMKLLDMKM